MQQLSRLLIVILALALVLPTASFAQDDPVDLRFTLWIADDHPAIAGVFRPLADAYTAQNPNVTIEYVFIPNAEYASGLGVQLSGNDAPDAGWMLERDALAFRDAGVLLDLSDVLVEDAAYNYADFSTSLLGLWTADEAVYGIPFSSSPFITIYNAELFEEAGLDTPAELAARGEWTWEALAEAARVIREETGAWGFVGNDGSARLYGPDPWTTLAPLMRAYGGDLLVGNECTFDSEGSVEAMELLHRMIYEDRSTVPPGDEVNFWPGEVGITLGQISRLANLDEATFEWGIAPLPSGPTGDVAVVGQAAIVVFDGENNENQEVAADFVRFLTTEESVTQ
ncbi:MAG: sugar ABC transporter substrate-binding protein [Anaerolineae bacterium]|nr:sugar ABC transporter substrate-binding protein [Anaerolineae bacterium]